MPDTTRPASTGRDLLGVAAVMLLAVVLYIPTLGTKALWNDEAFSYFVAYRGLTHALEFISSDTHPPLYYLVLNLWLHLGGTPFVLRLLSAVAVILSVPPLYDAARRLCGPPVALLALVLFVLDSNTANWAQKARPYGLQTLFVAISLWGFVRIYTDPAATRVRIFTGLARPETRGVNMGWLAYAVGGALAMLTQQPAGFFILACNILIAVRLLAAPPRRTLLINWCLAQFLLIAVWLMWLPAFLGQISGNLTPAAIAARHTNFLILWPDVLATLADLFGTSSLWSLQPVMLLLCAALVVAALARRPGTQRPEPVVPSVVALPVLVGLLGFVFVHPVFGYVLITFVWLMLPYSILLASGVMAAGPRLVQLAAGTALLALTALAFANYLRTPNQPLDQVAAAIAADLHPGDGVVLSRTGAGRWALAYYLGAPYTARLAGLDIARQWDEDAFIRTPAEAVRQNRVWFLIPEGETLPFTPDALAPGMTQAFSRSFGRIKLIRMDASPAR